jgi:hypothetical protein
MSEPNRPVGAIFDAALELPPKRRAAHLHEACARDEAFDFVSERTARTPFLVANAAD